MRCNKILSGGICLAKVATKCVIKDMANIIVTIVQNFPKKTTPT
jgi:hypothetical protein